MKVLLINHFPLKGSGSGFYIANIAKSLTKKGHEVCIIFPENTTDIQKMPNIKIHPVYFKREEKIKGQLDFNFPCMDPHPRSNVLFENLTDKELSDYVEAFRKAISEEITSFKPDIIHTQHIWIISGIVSEFDVPYIITSHGAEFITYKKTNRFDEFGKNAMKKANKVIAISEDNINDIKEKFSDFSDEKIERVKNGYNSNDFFCEDLDKEKVLTSLGINKKYEKIVLFVGRVSKLKGIDTLINAAKIYNSENILTIIAGDGGDLKELENMKNSMNLDNVVFVGNKEQSELRKLYNISDVFVLPSRKEALPLSAIEALACGTPVIISNLYGMEKIITKNVGLIFELDNEQMLAEQIKSILEGNIIFDKEEIIKHAQNNYSEEKLMDSLIKLYNIICKKK